MSSVVTKLQHLTHLEELPLFGETSQAISILSRFGTILAGNVEKSINTTLKFDGSPSVVFGVNPENGKFFVGTKGVFAQNPKINYTPKDIDTNHPGEGLNKKLKIALKYLPELGIRDVVQGDFLFTHDELVPKFIDGVNYITFRPNTITYAVPLMDSSLASAIQGAQMGIVIHSSYTGDNLSDMTVSFGYDTSHLRSSKNVWYQDALIHDISGRASFTADEMKEYENKMKLIIIKYKLLNPNLVHTLATMDSYRVPLMTYYNTKVREGQKIGDTSTYIRDFIQWLDGKLSQDVLASKREDTRLNRLKIKTTTLKFYQNNKTNLKILLDFQNLLTDAKIQIIRKLESLGSLQTFIQQADGTYKVTRDEGFVAVDHLTGGAIKLVDRLEFSFNNFTLPKNWIKEATHFVGFKGDEYTRAKKIFGEPDFIHRKYDKRAKQEIVPGDRAIFANGSEKEYTGDHPSFDDSEVYAQDKEGRIPNHPKYLKDIKEGFKRPIGQEEHDEVSYQLQNHPSLPDHVKTQLTKMSSPEGYREAMRKSQVKLVSPHEAKTGIDNTGDSWEKSTWTAHDEKRKRVSNLFRKGSTITTPIVLHHKESGHKHLLAGHHRLTYNSQVLNKSTPVTHVEY